MFDQLTESNRNEKDTRGRKSYFILTALIVGALFISGVVWSLYAKDLVLGAGDIELSVLVAPVPMPENAPRPPQPKIEKHIAAVTETAPKTTRQTNMLRPDEVPIVPPKGVATTPNTTKARTDNFVLDPGPEKDKADSGVQGSGRTDGSNDSASSSSGGQTAVVEPPQNTIPPPPDIKKADPPVEKKKDVIISGGVVNGKAKVLPKPVYSAAAIALRVTGVVNVQVMIDENGRVVSAKAISGPALLRQSAERAAFDARFSPTFLSDQPVKVTGVIAYNFNRN